VIRGLSHIVIATENVDKMAAFFEQVFEQKPHFSNSAFADFVLPNKARVAFFLPVGKAAKFFDAQGPRSQVSYGVTVDDVDNVYERVVGMNLSVSGPPKDHPWGERSFLLIDPDGNRWEVTRSPSEDGFLKNLDHKL
jgi:predicted enzyme related to lactoylglutathione lyase